MKAHIYTVFLILVFVSMGIKTICAQDPDFSQPYANPLYLNPAFAGTGNSQRIGLNYRNQWPDIPGDFITYNISYDRNIIDTNDGIGILANMDKSGQSTLTTDNVGLIYAHQFHIKSFTLSAGLQATYQYLSFDESKLNYGNTVNPVRGFIYTNSETILRSNVGVPDFSAGVMGYGKNYFLGLTYNHVTQPNESFVTGISPLPIKYTTYVGFNLYIASIVLSPTVLYRQQGNDRQTLLECYATKGSFMVAIGERSQDAFIFMLGYHWKFLWIGYSYDYTISSLTNASTGGAHEVSLAILLPYKSERLKKVNGINCPSL